MQSLLCLFNRVFHWPRRARHADHPSERFDTQEHPVASETHVHPTRWKPGEQSSTLPNTRISAPLTVKLHRDNLLDQTSLPTRLVICGRMADVHAELERLAAMEAMA